MNMNDETEEQKNRILQAVFLASLLIRMKLRLILVDAIKQGLKLKLVLDLKVV